MVTLFRLFGTMVYVFEVKVQPNLLNCLMYNQAVAN
jgi:hypothetical protein